MSIMTRHLCPQHHLTFKDMSRYHVQCMLSFGSYQDTALHTPPPCSDVLNRNDNHVASDVSMMLAVHQTRIASIETLLHLATWPLMIVANGKKLLDLPSSTSHPRSVDRYFAAFAPELFGPKAQTPMLMWLQAFHVRSTLHALIWSVILH